MLETLLHTLRVERRSLLAWTIGLVATVLLYLAFYPSIADNGAAYEKTLQNFPEALKRLSGAYGDLTSPAGYMQGQFYATFGFILLLVFAIGRGAKAIAGEERNGTLELVLSTPLTRTRFVLARAAGLGVEVLGLSIATAIVLLALGPAFELSLPFGHLMAATVSFAMGAYVFGLVALAAGAAKGEYGLAIGVGAGVSAAGFFYTTLSPLVSSLAGHQSFSPCWQAFGYEPLIHGLDLGNLMVLVAEAAVLIGLSIWLLGRRDVG